MKVVLQKHGGVEARSDIYISVFAAPLEARKSEICANENKRSIRVISFDRLRQPGALERSLPLRTPPELNFAARLRRRCTFRPATESPQCGISTPGFSRLFSIVAVGGRYQPIIEFKLARWEARDRRFNEGIHFAR